MARLSTKQLLYLLAYHMNHLAYVMTQLSKPATLPAPNEGPLRNFTILPDYFPW